MLPEAEAGNIFEKSANRQRTRSFTYLHISDRLRYLDAAASLRVNACLQHGGVESGERVFQRSLPFLEKCLSQIAVECGSATQVATSEAISNCRIISEPSLAYAMPLFTQ